MQKQWKGKRRKWKGQEKAKGQSKVWKEYGFEGSLFFITPVLRKRGK